MIPGITAGGRRTEVVVFGDELPYMEYNTWRIAGPYVDSVDVLLDEPQVMVGITVVDTMLELTHEPLSWYQITYV